MQSDTNSRSAEAAALRDFAVADVFAEQVPPDWLPCKDRGNEALAQGDLESAALHYTQALAIADGSAALNAFFETLDGRPAGSAGPMLHGAQEDIAPVIRRFLPGPRASLAEPNRPAAICTHRPHAAYAHPS